MKKKTFLRVKETYNRFNNEYKKAIVFGEDRKSNAYLYMLEEKIRFYIRMNWKLVYN